MKVVIEAVLKYVRVNGLLLPGERVAAAVSGGADSVALLRVLLELRQELGIVLSVAHFHHGIRGAEADADALFVRSLAGQLQLQIHEGMGDTPAHSREQKISLETAARELRHRWFAELLAQGAADRIATAHTLDDQAETVLMRLLRGAGSRGLAAIFPIVVEKHLVRPLLQVGRRDVEAYLTSISQHWREDSSNRDLSHTRNRIRHELLPLLEREFNPSIRQTLADLAEISRAEAEYWKKETSSLLARLVHQGKPSRSGRAASGDAAYTLALDIAAFRALPAAARRQVLYQVGEQAGVSLEFKHIQDLSELVEGKPGRRLLLPGGVTAVRSFRELQLGPRQNGEDDNTGHEYLYVLAIPGEIAVPELGSIIRARLVPAGERGRTGYNDPALLDRSLLAPELTVRNWRAGDRFLPAKTRSPRKLKELLQPGRLGQRLSLARKKAWPVVESAGEIVWVRGFTRPDKFAPVSGENREAVVIEESEFHSGTEE
jgi:tRNA(Ile)-lysidine synthase